MAQATDAETVANFEQFHARLAGRLDELRARVPGNYEMTVEHSPYSDGNDRISVTIKSDDWVLNEDEIGDRRFHVILRQQGGLALATCRTELLGDKRDYLDRYSTKGKAWSRLLRDVKAAK